jgi:hypothetical protein
MKQSSGSGPLPGIVSGAKQRDNQTVRKCRLLLFKERRMSSLRRRVFAETP